MKAFFEKLSSWVGGTSPMTGYIGLIVFVGQAVAMIQEALATQTPPTNVQEWLTLLVGVGLRMSKDFNRTHAVRAHPESTPAPPTE